MNLRYRDYAKKLYQKSTDYEGFNKWLKPFAYKLSMLINYRK